MFTLVESDSDTEKVKTDVNVLTVIGMGTKPTSKIHQSWYREFPM